MSSLLSSTYRATGLIVVAVSHFIIISYSRLYIYSQTIVDGPHTRSQLSVSFLLHELTDRWCLRYSTTCFTSWFHLVLSAASLYLVLKCKYLSCTSQPCRLSIFFWVRWIVYDPGSFLNFFYMRFGAFWRRTTM